MSKIINSTNDFYDCLYYDIIPHEGQDFVWDNQSFLKSELNKIYDLITGRSTPIAPFITTKDGKKSERKIWSLINRIVECCRIDNEKMRYSSDDVKERCERQNKIEKEFYRCYLYCAINGIAVIKENDFRPIETFGDLIDNIPASTDYREILELDFILSKNFELFHYNQGYDGFYSTMFCAYRLLTGKMITEDFTDKDWEIISDLVKEREQDELENMEQSAEWEREIRTNDDGTYMSDEEFEDIFRYEQEHMPEPTPEEEKYYKDEKILIERSKAARDKWLSSMTNPEKFLQCYRKLRKLIRDGKIKDKIEDFNDGIVNHIREMIECFICANGFSDCIDNARIVDAVRRIRHTKSVIERDRRRRGIK